MGLSKIIAISGFSGSGKDTVAEMLRNLYSDAYRWTYIHSMAQPIKNAVRELFQLGEDPAYEKKDEYNEFFTKLLKVPTTYRDVMNKFGTMCRENFSDTIFADITKNIYECWSQCFNTNTLFIIPDIRFKVELNMLQEWRNEGKDVEHWIVLRESKLPVWCKLGYNFNDPIDIQYVKSEFKPPVAESEWCFENPKFRRVIYNDGTLTELGEQIAKIIESFDPLWNTTTK